MEKSIKITNLSFLHFVISLNPLSFHNKVCVLFVFQQKLVHPGSSPTSFQQFLRAIQKLPQDTVLNNCLKKKVCLNFLGCVWWCVCVCVCVCVYVVKQDPWTRNGNPFQNSGLENSMDREAWRAIVHGVTKSWRQLSMHRVK